MMEAPNNWDELSTSPRRYTDSPTPTIISMSKSVADCAALMEARPRAYIVNAITVHGTPSQSTDSHPAGVVSVLKENGPPAIVARGAIRTVIATIRAKERDREETSYFFPSTMNIV